jgi:ABC-type sugar transport system ATPase subunit
MTGIRKEFPGVLALAGVDFKLKPGEVHALLGMNGAGKSTLIKILSGVYAKDAGSIALDGLSIEIQSPLDAVRHGIATVYQDPEMIPSFTGYENIFLGFENARKGPFATINRKELREKAEAILEQFPVEVDLTRPVAELKAVDQEIIAILRALSRKMSVLVLDEPTSILTETETKVLFRLIEALKGRGVSIIYITHRLEEVYRIADRLTVLRDGGNVATLETKGAAADPMAIAELMLGKHIDKIFPDKASRIGEEIIAVQELCLEGRFRDVSFSVCKGQIMGIFGLVGSGVEDLAKTLFGVFQPSSGRVKIRGREIRHHTPGDAIRNGLFLIPGNRRVEGLIAVEPIVFNVSLANLKRVIAALGLINHSSEKNQVQEIVEKLSVTPPDLKRKVTFLSGGNQQKVVICKGLFTKAEIYVFAEPTAGVDVGAKASIYRLMRELAKEAAVIIISSDCTEVYGMADRAMVMFQGRVTMDRNVCNMREEEMLLCGVKGSESRVQH